MHVTPDSLLISRSLSDPDEIWCVTSWNQDLSAGFFFGRSPKNSRQKKLKLKENAPKTQEIFAPKTQEIGNFRVHMRQNLYFLHKNRFLKAKNLKFCPKLKDFFKTQGQICQKTQGFGKSTYPFCPKNAQK